MEFDPEQPYQLRDLSNPANLALYKFKELVVTLISIGADAATQKNIAGPISAVADEMAVDYDA